MSDEWGLNQLVNRPFYKDLIRKRLRNEIDEIIKEQAACLNRIDVTLWAHILSYINKDDVAPCRLVCRKWYDASKKRHFWTKIIMRQLRKVAKSSYTKNAREFVPKFDTFGHPEQSETLKDQIEWIYRKSNYIDIGSAGTREKGYSGYYVTRYTSENRALCFIFGADFNLRKIRYFSPIRLGSTKSSGLNIWWDLKPGKRVLRSERHSMPQSAGDLIKVTYRYRDGETVTVDLIAPFDGKIKWWIHEELARLKSFSAQDKIPQLGSS